MIYHGDAYQYVEETPDVLNRILEKQEEIFSECISYLRQKKIQKIFLTGSGSSYHSAAVSAGFIKKLLGIPVSAVYPADYIENMEKDCTNTLLIGISQQGTSTAVIKALDMMREHDGMTISCTGEYSTEITRHGDAVLYVECGIEDAGSTTKGYTAAILTLDLLGIYLAKQQNLLGPEEYDLYKNQIREMINQMDTVIDASCLWCRRQVERLAECEDLIVLASGRCKALLPEIVLKFSEACRFPVRGYEPEEFMHGMYNAVNNKTQFLCLFDGKSTEDERLMKLAEYYKERGNELYCINNDMNYGINGCFTENNLFSVLEYILPFQILFILTSRKRGIDFNIPKDPDFHKYMQSKLEFV